MRETFKGFLLLRLIGFGVLVVVVATVLGIRSLARGSDAVGLAALAGALLLALAIGSLIARRRRARPR